MWIYPNIFVMDSFQHNSILSCLCNFSNQILLTLLTLVLDPLYKNGLILSGFCLRNVCSFVSICLLFKKKCLQFSVRVPTFEEKCLQIFVHVSIFEILYLQSFASMCLLLKYTYTCSFHVSIYFSKISSSFTISRQGRCQPSQEAGQRPAIL